MSTSVEKQSKATQKKSRYSYINLNAASAAGKYEKLHENKKKLEKSGSKTSKDKI